VDERLEGKGEPWYLVGPWHLVGRRGSWRAYPRGCGRVMPSCGAGGPARRWSCHHVVIKRVALLETCGSHSDAMSLLCLQQRLRAWSAWGW